MRVIIQKDYETLSAWAAAYVVRRIKKFNPTAEKPFVLGLPTGSSPLGMYKELIRLNKEGQVSFKNVVTFNMDEYVGIPGDHPESYHSFMWKNLFGKVDIPKKNVNILNGNARNLERECAAYEAKIKRLGGIKLFLRGKVLQTPPLGVNVFVLPALGNHGHGRCDPRASNATKDLVVQRCHCPLPP